MDTNLNADINDKSVVEDVPMAQSDAEQHEDDDDVGLSGFAMLRARFNPSQH